MRELIERLEENVTDREMEQANLSVRIHNVVDRLNAMFKKEYGGFKAVIKWKGNKDPIIVLNDRGVPLGTLVVKGGEVVIANDLNMTFKSRYSKTNPFIAKVEKVVATQGR